MDTRIQQWKAQKDEGADEAAPLLTFADGLLGFEELRQFELRSDPEGGAERLYSLDDGSVAFPVLDPAVIWPDYRPEFAASDVAALGIDDAAEIQVLVVVTAHARLVDISVNLRAPLLINRRSGAARQVILADARYPIHAPILAAIAGQETLQTSAPALAADQRRPGTRRRAA